jgi:hypothetical protein
MFELAAHTTAAPQVAQATDGVTNFFLLLAAGAFAIVLLRLIHVGDLGDVLRAVGGVITAVVVITVVALLIFVVLVAFHSLLTF